MYFYILHDTWRVLNFFAGEENKKKEFEDEKRPVDIGFPAARLNRSEETKLRLQYNNQIKNNPEIEKLARHLKCKHQLISPDE